MDSIAPLPGPDWGTGSGPITGIIVQYIDEYHIYNLACMLLNTLCKLGHFVRDYHYLEVKIT